MPGIHFTQYLAARVLDWIFGNVAYTPPEPLYVGLLRWDLDETAAGEPYSPSQGFSIGEPQPSFGYARVALPNNSAGWDAASGGQKALGTAIKFPTATSSWGQITYWFLNTHEGYASGHFLVVGSLNPPRTVTAGKQAQLLAGDGIVLTLD